MSTRETFALEGMSASVEETPDALTYTFAPPGRMWRAGLPLRPSLVFFLVVYPLGLLVLTGYARSEVANRPLWEDALAGLFAAQLLAWLVVGTAVCGRSVARWCRSSRVVLTFTPTHLWHGGARVCELEHVRGLRLFVSPPTARLADEPLPQSDACLSLVIGEDGGTHGLFGGFAEPPLRAFAEDLHRRLAAFRSNQGLMTALDPLSVVNTTEADAAERMHTRPATASPNRTALALAEWVFRNRWGGGAWFAAMLAGAFASGRMIAAAGLGSPFLIGHGFLGVVSFGFLLAYLRGADWLKGPLDAA